MKWFVMILLCGLMTAAPAQDTGPDDARVAAARELLQALDMRQVLESAMAASFDAQLKANPALEPYRDVMLQWARTYVTWEAFEPKLVELYAQSFTVDEVHDMIAFYSTPTGHKSLTMLPELMQKGGEIGAGIAAEHQAELAAMIEKRRVELEGK